MYGWKTWCTGCSMQSRGVAACRAIPAEQWMVLMQANTMVGGAACRAVRATCAMILMHMVMDGMGQMQTRASRHGVKAEAGRQGMARPAQAAVAKTTRPVGEAGRPLVSFWRFVEGVRWCRPVCRRARTYPTVSLPTYRLCLSLSIPTPLVCQKIQPI